MTRLTNPNRSNTVGIILAAGNQKRFLSDIPKPLVSLVDETILEMNIKAMRHYVDYIFVVVNPFTQFLYKQVIDKYLDVELLPIFSGLGCGHAALSALERIRDYPSAIMIWGDSIQNQFEIYDELVSRNPFGKMYIPVVEELDPYTNFIFDHGSGIHTVEFKKRGQVSPESLGWHDLSIFYFDTGLARVLLLKLHEKYWNEERQDYDMIHGRELTFLDIFNTELSFYGRTDFGKVIKMDGVKSQSFNTIEEFEIIWREFNEFYFRRDR
jgi:NDP-sugar pyrophosphorylase family protein